MTPRMKDRLALAGKMLEQEKHRPWGWPRGVWRAYWLTRYRSIVRDMVWDIKARDEIIERQRATGQFLLDRLEEFEGEIDTDATASEFDGHVAPAIARFRSALTEVE
jgi:hypothetical protein